MHLVIEKATQYQNTVSKYEAEIYIKGRTEILKQNMFLFMSVLKKIKDFPSGTKFLEQKLLSNKYTYFN